MGWKRKEGEKKSVYQVPTISLVEESARDSRVVSELPLLRILLDRGERFIRRHLHLRARLLRYLDDEAESSVPQMERDIVPWGNLRSKQPHSIPNPPISHVNLERERERKRGRAT